MLKPIITGITVMVLTVIGALAMFSPPSAAVQQSLAQVSAWHPPASAIPKPVYSSEVITPEPHHLTLVVPKPKPVVKKVKPRPRLTPRPIAVPVVLKPAPTPEPTQEAVVPQPAPTPTAQPVQQESGAQAAVNFAYAQLGCPYVYGGTGPCNDGFDCSGLVMKAWENAGVTIPRTSEEQWAGLTHVSTSDLEPGDILVMYGAEHVGLYVGGGMMIDAPQTGLNVEKVPIPESALIGAVRP